MREVEMRIATQSYDMAHYGVAVTVCVGLTVPSDLLQSASN